MFAISFASREVILRTTDMRVAFDLARKHSVSRVLFVTNEENGKEAMFSAGQLDSIYDPSAHTHGTPYGTGNCFVLNCGMS